MLSPKRIKLMLAVTLVSVTLIALGLTLDVGHTAPAKPLRAKLLRRHDKTTAKPDNADKDYLRKHAAVQEEKKEERQLEDKIPKHLPITIKVRKDKEKAFRDLDNKDWGRDFELEVKNTGTKPIYRLVLLLILPETQIGEGRILFSLRYGRAGLSAFQEPLELARPEDVPIKPGETYTFRISEGQVRGWKHAQSKEGWPQPKKIVIKFEQLNFGDGTAFRWGEGVAWSHDKKASVDRCLQSSDKSKAKANHARPAKKKDATGAIQFLLGGEPAKFWLGSAINL